MKLIEVNKSNIGLLENFISNMGESANTFRYYSKRSVNAIDYHLITLLLNVDGKNVAYGHLDKEDQDVWIGVCVTASEKFKGYGKVIVSAIIDIANKMSLGIISLTVDKTNSNAISLYEKMGFVKVRESQTYFKYDLILSTK